MSPEAKLAIDLLLGVVKAVPAVGEVIGRLAGTSSASVVARLEMARASIADPLDTTADDLARRRRLDEALGLPPDHDQALLASRLELLGVERSEEWARAMVRGGLPPLPPIGERETLPPTNPFDKD